MTTTQMVTELISRGAESDTTRNEQWLNLAYKEIWNAYGWPFAEAEVTGAGGAGLVTTPTDFRQAIYVTDKSGGTPPGRPLDFITMAELQEDYKIEDLSKTAQAEFWYIDNVLGQIKAYPLGGTIYMRYYKRAATITGGGSPLIPADYHMLIIDRALVEVYKDNDEQAQGEKQLAFYDRQLLQMARDFQVVSRATSYIQVGTPYDG